ncbi:MAG TPA: DUF3943 domain-containing protein, partial [Chitinophagaceae bacterium]|nr:DUF3943 domain-containing protein [Chitinophagaceae bacterium]
SMKKLIYRSWLKFTAFVLSSFLNIISLAQDKGLDAFYPCQQVSTSKIDFHKINLKTKVGIFPAYNRNLKTPAITLPDTFLSKRSDVPLLRNENAGIWKKIGRAELFIGGAELLGATALIVAPNDITKWSPDWERDAWRHMKRSLSKLPVWDDDEWQINFIGHPVSGSFYYNSLRSQNAGILHSFLFATAQSFIWEYIIEATSEKPSTQDLIITPIVGSILGESIHRLTMSMRKNGFNFFEKVFVLIFNPPFVFNNGFGPRFNPIRQNQVF